MSLLPPKFSPLQLPSKLWAAWRRPVVNGVLGVGTVWMGVVGLFAMTQFGVYYPSEVDSTRMQMSRLGQRIEIYGLRHKHLPSRTDGLVAMFPDGVPTDAWGNAIIYFDDDDESGRDFDLLSLGADGRYGGEGFDSDVWYSDRNR